MMTHMTLHPRYFINKQYASRKEENSLVLRSVKMHSKIQNSINTPRRAKTSKLQQPLTTTATIGQTGKQQKLENKHGKKNNYIDTSSDKLAWLHMRRTGHSQERKMSKEKLNLLKHKIRTNYISVENADCISAEGQESSNECPVFNTKQPDDEAPVMLELWGMWSTSLLP